MSVTVRKRDNNHIRIETDIDQYHYDLEDFFSNYVDGYEYMPSYRSGIFDGKIKFYQMRRKTLPYGLLGDLYSFHKKNYPNTSIQIDKEVKEIFSGKSIVSLEDLKWPPRPYQKEGIEKAIKNKKCILRVSTSGGKSLIIAYILHNLFHLNDIKNGLIVVPSKTLIKQFQSDLVEYGFKDSDIGLFYSGEKTTDRKITISTWQSLMKRHKMLKDYDCLIVDEVHQAQSNELRMICEKALCDYKIGLTGTLPNSPVDVYNIKSYLGPVIQDVSARQLIDDGFISDVKIVLHKIEYKENFNKIKDYHELKEELFKNNYRLSVLEDIANQTTSSVIYLCERKEKEAEVLYNYLKNTTNIETVYLNGSSSVEEREKYRKIANERKINLIATYQIFQQGVNIPSLKDIVLASSTKSKVRALQSVGRILRLHPSKFNGARVHDICDCVTKLEKHLDERSRIYTMEEFEMNEVEHKEPDFII